MTQKKNSWEYDDRAVITTAVIVALMFIAAMVYNKDNFKRRAPQPVKKEQPTIKPATKDIKTFVANNLFKQNSK